MDIIIRDVEEFDGQYKIYNKDGTGGHWYITKESAEQISGQIEPRVSLPSQVIFILFRKLFTTDNPEYIESYTDYDLAQMEMVKASQDDPQRNYYLQCVIPKARSN